ncbi:hypothetical protein [Streptomyces cacaoi]|uniref:hypothetical protein n=1 Tax=Streptomyces cacaoi TaxID=1898 RepID=UPI00374A2ED5
MGGKEKMGRGDRVGLLRRSSFGVLFKQSNGMRPRNEGRKPMEAQELAQREFTPELRERMNKVLEKNQSKPLLPGAYPLKRAPDVPVPSPTDLSVWEVAGRVSINDF